MHVPPLQYLDVVGHCVWSSFILQQKKFEISYLFAELCFKLTDHKGRTQHSYHQLPVAPQIITEIMNSMKLHIPLHLIS